MGLSSVRIFLSSGSSDRRVSRARGIAVFGLALAIVLAVAGLNGLPQIATAAADGSVWSQIDSSEDDAYHDPASWPNYSDDATRILAGAPGSNGPTYGGWRWDDLGIPEGAVITSAYVELTQQGWGFNVETSLALQDEAAPTSFSRDSSPFDRWQDRTGFEVSWNWEKDRPNSVIRTPDLTAGVQELVDRYGALDAIVMVESGEGVTQREYHEWRSFDRDPARSASLHVEWTMPDVEPTSTPTPGPGADGSVWAHIDSGEDDAHHDPVSWPNYSGDDTRILAGAPGSNGPTYGGWRWDDLDIPGNAVITSAYVELTQQNWGFEFETNLALQDEAAPQSFSRESSPYDRWKDRTDFEVNWTWDKGRPGTVVRTPDMTAGVQELVDRYGPLDAIVMMESGEGVTLREFHEWFSYERDAGRSAALHVEWTLRDVEPEPGKVNWDGIGEVLFVGPSQNPAAVTSATSQFSFNDDGSIDQVVVTTMNEFVAGVLVGPGGTSALTACSDDDGGISCARLAGLLTGALVSSLHTSTATLDVIVEAVVPVPVTTPGGEIFLNVPIVGGLLTGNLNGAFVVNKGIDLALGSVSLEIQPGSSGTYACFGVTSLGLGPLETLEPCINGTGGQFFPIELDVTDRGTFAVGQGTGVLSELMGLSGDVQVEALSNLFLQTFGGVITITDGEAVLAPLAP